MKFLVSKDIKPSPLLKSLMANIMVIIIFYMFLDILLHSYLFGFDISSIKATIFGDKENFIEPILLETLLIQVHIDLFMTLFGVMILSSIYIRYYSLQKYTKKFLHLLFLSSLLSPILLIVSFFSYSFVLYLWIFVFILWHLLALIMAFLNLKKIWFV